MARLRSIKRDGRRIAVVEDDPQLLASTVQLLSREGHEVRGAANGADGVALVRQWKPQLTLLDYYMPGATGADVVRQIRTFDQLGQILLVTGYASEQPARTLLAELDIQGYHDKADGPARLMVLVDAALKHFDALARVDRQRRYLSHIVEVSPRINRLQPTRELLQTALREIGVLLQGEDGFIATENNGIFVLDEPSQGVSIHAAIGQYAGTTRLAELSPALAGVVSSGIASDAPFVTGDGHVVIPLRTRNGDRGCMVVDSATLPTDAVDACVIYAQQVVQALENVVLFERATVDPLTELYNRGFGLQRLDETLRLASRSARPTAAIMIDLDRFKSLNDTLGHAAGDVALRGVGRAVTATVRTTDVCARYGGEELLVVLPDTELEGAMRVAERVRQAIRDLELPFDDGFIRLTASLGVAATVHESGAALLRCADAALYRAKGAGRDRVCGAEEREGSPRGHVA